MKIIVKNIIKVLISCIVAACTGFKKDKEARELFNSDAEIVQERSLLENVKLAINPKYKDWVLFENGTYIIFDNLIGIDSMEEEAIRLMKEFGPVSAGNPSGDFSVTYLKDVKGWSISGHGYGMYTYVNPLELDNNSPSDVEIGIYGRSKRDKDGKHPKIIHVNKNE